MSLLSSLLSNLSASEQSGNAPPKVYLQNNGTRLQFPIPPGSFDVNVKQNNSVVNINNIGELNMIGKTGLITMNFSSFFPAQQYSFCQCTPNEPYDYVKTIDAWRTSGRPCRFIMTGTPINYAVTIDDFTWGEHDGTGDVYFVLSFREYRFVGGAKDSTQVNEVTGLKDRKDSSFIEQSFENITVYPADSIGDVVGRAIKRTANTGSNDNNVLSAYKKIAKSGGIKAGDIITYTAVNDTLKVGGKLV